MLEAIRKRSASFLVKLLLGLLIVSFGIWGIGDTIRRGIGTPDLASVGPVDIRPNDFEGDFQRELNRLRSLFGPTFDRDQARAMGLATSVLDGMITRILFSLEAKHLGVAISDDLVAKNIRNNRVFRNLLGAFDREKFQQALLASGWTEDVFVDRLRDDLARDQYVDSIEKGAVAPSDLVDAVYRYRQEKRVALAVFVADKDMTGIREPDDATLAKFHTEHAARFTAPEYRALTVVNLEAKDLAKEIVVSAQEIKDAYAARRDEFKRSERRHVLQMVLADETTAKRAHKMLVAGQSFAEVAKNVAGMDAETLDLGFVGRDNLLPEMADTAFGLKKGAVSEPVQSPLGWHILAVTDVDAAREQTLDEVRETLTNQIAHDKAVESLFELANRLEDNLGGGATLEESASQLNLKIFKIPAIDRRGRDAAGKIIAHLPKGDQFLSTAFESEEGVPSLLTEAGTDGYFVLRVDHITPPTLRPLESIRDEVVTAWKAEKRAEVAEKEAKTLVERLKTGAYLKTLAAERNAEVSITAPFVRTVSDGSTGLPQTVVSNVFAIKPGDATFGRGEAGYYVAVLKEIIAADPTTDEQGVAALREEFTNSLRNDLVIQLADALRGRYSVSVNQRAFEQLF